MYLSYPISQNETFPLFGEYSITANAKKNVFSYKKQYSRHKHSFTPLAPLAPLAPLRQNSKTVKKRHFILYWRKWRNGASGASGANM